jgi:hypothetical protein
MYEAWDRGKGAGARSGTSPVSEFPSTMPDLPSISFLRGSDIAQSAPVSPHIKGGGLCCFWRRHSAWIGHHCGMSEAAQSPCGLIAATLFLALAPGRERSNSRSKHLLGSRGELFHHLDVHISADVPQRYNRTRASTSSARRVCGTAGSPLPARLPRSRPSSSPQEAPVTRHVSLSTNAQRAV